MRITIKYGTGNELNADTSAVVRDLGPGLTAKQIISVPRIKAALGYGDNVEAFIGGAANDAAIVVDGMTLSVHDKACQKAKEVAA